MAEATGGEPLNLAIQLSIENDREVIEALRRVTSEFEKLANVIAQIPTSALPAIGTLTSGLVDLEGNVQDTKTNIINALRESKEVLRGIAADLGTSVRQAERILVQYLTRLETQGQEAANKYYQSHKRMNEAIREVAQTQKEFIAVIGSTGMALRGMVRSFFWTGLSAMFTTMSFARLARQSTNVERSTRNLKRVHEDYNEVVKESRQIISMYGRTSEEGVDANKRMEDALYRLQDAELAVRSAMEQKTLATFMFVFGAVPSFIRASSDMTESILRILLSHYAGVGGLIAWNQQVDVSTVAILRHLPIIGTMTLTYAKLAAMLSIVTIGVAAVVGALAFTAAMQSAEQHLASYRQEAGLTAKQLAGSGLVEALDKTHDAMVRVGKVTRDIGPLGDVNLPVTRIGNVTVSFGNVTVRSTEDIGKIARRVVGEIDKIRQNSYLYRGGT